MKFWTIAPVALLVSACLSHPAPSPAPYRAVGQEPGWTLIIDERDLTFIRAGEQPIRQPRPDPIIGIAGEIYQTPRIGVNVVHTTCTDVMSGQAYRDRVQVDVDGRRFEGCGGDRIAPTQLANTNWRVDALNGRPMPSEGQYYLQFEADRIGAKFGCNSMGGSYSRTGDLVTVSDLVATQMACAEPAMSFESQGSAILRQPMTVSMSGDRMSLTNSAGRIELRQTF